MRSTVKPGDKYGMLTLVELTQPGRQAKWRVKCDCGTAKEIRIDNILAGVSRSCGCQRVRAHQRQMQDLSGGRA